MFGRKIGPDNTRQQTTDSDTINQIQSLYRLLSTDYSTDITKRKKNKKTLEETERINKTLNTLAILEKTNERLYDNLWCYLVKDEIKTLKATITTQKDYTSITISRYNKIKRVGMRIENYLAIHDLPLKNVKINNTFMRMLTVISYLYNAINSTVTINNKGGKAYRADDKSEQRLIQCKKELIIVKNSFPSIHMIIQQILHKLDSFINSMDYAQFIYESKREKFHDEILILQRILIQQTHIELLKLRIASTPNLKKTKKTVYDKYPQLKLLLQTPGKFVMAKRTAPVFAMKVPQDKIGKKGTTKIFDEKSGEWIVETTFNHQEVLLSNPDKNGDKSENERPKGEKSFLRDYKISQEEYDTMEEGKRYVIQSPSREFSPLLKVTEEVIEILGGKNGEAILPISWDENGAKIKLGSFITRRGTPLSKRDFECTYTEQE